MPYLSGIPTAPLGGIDQNLYVPGIHKQFFKEYIRTTPLYHLIGTNMDAPIYKHMLKDGEGLTFRIGRLQALDYRHPIVGTEQRRGNEMMQSLTYDEVNTLFRTWPVKTPNVDIVKLGTKIQIDSQVYQQLRDVFAQSLNYDLVRAATLDLYPDPTTQKPVYDRIHLSGVNAGAGTITRAIYNAYEVRGITKAIEFMGENNQGNAYNQNGLSAQTLLQLKIMADQGGADPNTEALIRPARVNIHDNAYDARYFYFMDPACLPALYADPMFSAGELNRGVVLPHQANIISGSDYIGRFRGIDIYTVPELTQFRQTSADGSVTAAWNLLIGAGAMALGWYKMPFFYTEFDGLERMRIDAVHEFRGQKALTFPGKVNPAQRVEQGIIHSFVRLNPAPVA